MNYLSSLLKNQRRTQRWLASQIGVSENTIGNWISGKTKPSIDQAQQIASLLDVLVDEIWPISHDEGRSDGI